MVEFIDRICFTSKEIQMHYSSLGANPLLIEKCIHAFALLGYLSQSQLSFVFKGGTCLLLHFESIQRMSIDIDIMTKDAETKIRSELMNISNTFPFIKMEENDRNHTDLPNRTHYKFYYKSAISNVEESVLLDIVLENPDYLPDLIWKPIRVPLIRTMNQLSVRVPSIECLLGDKMTAFAPYSTGVKFGEHTNMQVVKQLFDIGILFDSASEFQIVRESFIKICEKELNYRSNSNTVDHVLLDMINISIVICKHGLRGAARSDDAEYIVDGLGKLRNHLILKFDLPKAKIAASKVFCLANLIRQKKIFDFSKDHYLRSSVDVSVIKALPQPYQHLNKLKIIVPEAYYYLAKGCEG